ncbi:facilitated trehalose transporter Tret1-like [Bombyx mandarina]|uniref:Facilitated trehalose transporter Tret1-like n=1 Tax=Bombyx mandarina TaxID=7092 RepID=A0A6J2KIV4_BOMMA|nr:facilitated trehalose transporter Tret1-like [Bombyx mandarina]
MVYKFKISSNGGNAPVSRLKCVAAQLLASMSANLLLLDLGMAISFATIALPDLLNSKEGLSFNDIQASWFGSLSYLTQPLGAILSGPIVDYLGRKKASIFVNIPHLIAWILAYFSWNLPALFIANGLLGIGTGLMEAPIAAYVGEVTEHSIRGSLCTVTQLFLAIGILIMYFLGTVVNWRNAALISVGAPILAILFSLFVPETPVWLLSQGRDKDALDSLCYLRGWTTPDQVKEEFDDLVVYSRNLHQCVICIKEGEKEQDCDHHKMNIFKRSWLKFKYVMLGKATMRPLSLGLLYFMFYVMSGLTPIRPNMVNICGAFGMDANEKQIVLMVGILTFVAALFVIGLIKLAGKRKLGITAMLGTAISCTALSVYAKMNLSDSVFSYDTTTFPTQKSSIPLIFLYALTLFTGSNVSWVLLGEIFPFRSRATAQGIAAAWNYIVTFFASKTHIDLEISLRLWGTFAVYGAFAYAGTIYLYFFMPETEGVPLHEIENFYKGDLRTFADDPFIRFFRKILNIKM